MPRILTQKVRECLKRAHLGPERRRALNSKVPGIVDLLREHLYLVHADRIYEEQPEAEKAKKAALRAAEKLNRRLKERAAAFGYRRRVNLVQYGSAHREIVAREGLAAERLLLKHALESIAEEQVASPSGHWRAVGRHTVYVLGRQFGVPPGMIADLFRSVPNMRFGLTRENAKKILRRPAPPAPPRSVL